MKLRPDKQIQVTIRGVVQGVFFRQTVRRWAEELDLRGFVRNEPDDSLTICAQGKPADLETLVERCYHGPERAEVASVHVVEQDITIHYPSFVITHVDG